MDFLRVPLTALAGWLIYSERLDMFTVLGAALILTGNLLNLKAADPVPARTGLLDVDLRDGSQSQAAWLIGRCRGIRVQDRR